MRKVAPVLLSAVLIILMLPSAQAHSKLVSSTPAQSSILNTFPRTISLTFNEKLLVLKGQSPNVISVLTPSEKELAQAKTQIVGNTISITMKKLSTSGRFKVIYRVVSADGHPISGEYFFTVKSTS